jgi:hypothetical protein
VVAVADIRLDAAPAAQDELFEQIPRRHTSRGPYRPDRPIQPEILARFVDLVSDESVRVNFVTDPGQRSALGALIVEATARIIADPQMSADSARWFRSGVGDILAHRDGVTVDTSGLSPLLVAAAKLMPDQDVATADRYWLEMTRDTQVPTAPVLGAILVRDRLDMRSALAAGRAWQRLHLLATAAGIAAQPLNQPIECVDRNAMLGRADNFAPALAKLAEAPGWAATFAFRMGYAERAVMPSPRRPLEEVLTGTG